MRQEQPPKVELDLTLVRAYAGTFINRLDMYPIQLDTGTYVSVKKPLDWALVTLHLQGRPTLGAYALDEDSQAKWICFDADDRPGWRGLLAVARVLDQQGITAYLEPSRRGGHLWLFTPLLPGSEVRQFGRQLLAEHHLIGMELYPKQDQLVTGPGSFVRLPLGIHRKTGKRYHFVTLTGEPLAPTVREQIQLLTAPMRVPQGFIDQVITNAPAPRVVSPTPTFEPPGGDVTGETLSEKLKNRISVYDFVREYVELDPRGRGYCPFHDDHHKSFGVNQDGNYWHCWAGCGGGSVIDFWAKMREKQGEDPSFTATLTELATMLLPGFGKR